MSILINIGAIAAGAFLLTIVFRLMINKKMKESESILWLLIALVLIIIGIFPPVIPYIAEKLGIWYPPAILFIIAFIGILFIVFKNTITISIQANKLNELSIQVALLSNENKELRGKLKKEGDELKLKF